MSGVVVGEIVSDWESAAYGDRLVKSGPRGCDVKEKGMTVRDGE